MTILARAQPANGRAGGYRMVRAAKSDSADIYIYGPIGGGGWFSDGSEITASQFQKDLKALGTMKSLDVRINSEGGDVFDGKAIYTLLQANPATIAVHVDGLAASAASFIAMAGDTIEMAEGAMMMVHNAWSLAMGNAADLRRAADLLDAVDGTLVDVYAARTGCPADEIRQMMAEETWMDGKTALAKGFADFVVPNKAIAAAVRDPSRFRNTPAKFMPNRAAARTSLDTMSALLGPRAR